MRRLWSVLAVLLLLTACSAEQVGGDPDRTEAPTGPFDVAVPVEFARVLDTPSETSSTLSDPTGDTLHVEEPFLTVTRLDHAETVYQKGSAAYWALYITLTEDDGASFSQWTEDHVGDRVAVLVDGEIVFAPKIQQAIPGREVAISGAYTKAEAQALLHRITGR